MIKPLKKKNVYLDHAATTPMDKSVYQEMMPYFSNKYGNPSALYNLGRQALLDINNARTKIANLLHCQPDNIIFTGSGTEADNLAILGLAKQYEIYGKHIISLAIEHHAVLKPLEELKQSGFEITYIKTNKQGIVNPIDVINAIRPDTILISIMYANNEIGSIQPLGEIGKGIIKYRKENQTNFPYFHSDACQATGFLNLDVEKNHLDLMTINGSKVYGPKGIGLLYYRRGLKLKPLIFGGGQEKKLRSGTENVAYICGLAKALELAEVEKIKESSRQRKLNQYFWQCLQATVQDIHINGPEIGDLRLPNNLNVSFRGIEGEAMLLYLDEYGIMCSTGSACTSESLEPSHVLKAINLSYEDAHASLRFTTGKHTKKSDIDYVIKYLPFIINKLREISPSYKPNIYDKK